MKYIYMLWERKINPDGTLDPWLLEEYVDSISEAIFWVDRCDSTHFRRREKVKRSDLDNNGESDK